MTAGHSGRPEVVKIGAAELARALGSPEPTPEQRAIIESPLRATVIVAGAGSGKTETMAARVVWLIANGYLAPEDVLGLTFTRKAAGELSDRIARRLDRLRAAGLWTPSADDTGAATGEGTARVSTYHAYAGSLVREYAVLLGREPEARLLTEAAAWQHAAAAVAAYDGPMDGMDKRESTVIAAVILLSGELGEHLREVDEANALVDDVIGHIEGLPGPRRSTGPVAEALTALRLKRLVLPIVSAYAELKRSKDVLDFADQIALAAALAREVPAVGRQERARYKAVLLDEFQDTSEAQVDLLRHLFATGNSPIPVTAVGDPHQSIYGWRGASASTLARFAQAFADSNGPATALGLTTSWRNDEAVLAVANRLAEPLRVNAGVHVAALRARDGAGPGTVRVERLPTQLEEADRVAVWLGEQRAAHPGASAAVLCRKRSQFPAIVAALEERAIPHEVIGLGGLLTTPEVQDLVALLHVVADPGRGDQLMRLLTGPPVHLGAADLDALYAWARQRHPGPDRRQADLERDVADDVSLIDAIADLPEVRWAGPGGEHLSELALQRLGTLAAVVQRLRTSDTGDLADLVGQAERSLGLDLEVAARPEYTLAAARAHLDAFADVAAGFTDGADRPTLAAFLAWLDAAQREERGLDKGYIEPRQDAVQVLTVHSAKGLEWDVVAVPGLVEGTFPAHNAQTRKPPSDSDQPGVDTPLAGRVDICDSGWRVREVKERGWLGGLSISGIPYPLRGDADGLPQLRWAGTSDATELAEQIEEFRLAGGEHALAEERRLAYVAVTRARHDLLLTSHVWGSQRLPRVTSRFLADVLDLDAAHNPVRMGLWAPMPPPDDAEPPDGPEQHIVVWPDDPMAARRSRLIDIAGRVRHAVARPVPSADGDTRAVGGQSRAWQTDLELLLAERVERERAMEPVVDLPAHLSASALVSLAEDEQAYADELRRPMPTPPALAARRGTAFHAWVEQHYRQAAFVDLDELPGSADEGAVASVENLATLRQGFLGSEWAGRRPVAVEVPVETVLAGVALRGRIDAVFEVDGFEVLVDWKTGPVPTGDRAAVRSLQLGVYALAWSRLRGLPRERVKAAFFYAATGETIWPQLPGQSELVAVLTG